MRRLRRRPASRGDPRATGTTSPRCDPPTESASMADGIASASTLSSAFTSMRSAWNTRLAGWPARWAAAGVAAIRISTSCPDRMIGLLLPCGDDETRVAPGELLFAVALEDAAEIALAVRGDDIGGGDALGLVHPHVERGILRIREAALGLIELQRRDHRGRTGCRRLPARADRSRHRPCAPA